MMATKDKELVTCPYNEAHKMKVSRYQLHISKCRQQNEAQEKFICPFNATHVMTKPERTYHIQHCPDRASIDRKLTQDSLNKNNPYKGRTAVPSYNEVPVIVADEDWDLDQNDAFVPELESVKEAPQGAIIEPPAKSKPADRRRLYQDLHRGDEKEPEEPIVPPPLQTIPKTPKQPDTVSKIEALRKRDDLLNLGLAQNKSIPPQRIAASIYPGRVNGDINSVLKNLSIREAPRGGGYRPDENDFPVLGVGRGRAAK